MDLDGVLSVILRHLEAQWGIDAAWLFGSQVRGARGDSDIDLAVLFTRRPGAVELMEARSQLEQLAGRPVDVIDLDGASPVISHQAIKTGRLIVDRDSRRRVDFVARLPGRYEDLALIRRGIEKLLLRRIAHGRT